ncbi:hypothetical protein [Ornithinibacillus bavariensis]|uniref:Uncharacterized protein n=1 Tax=Ornithinibacillus bavariensis TaxID=545502 RepID=A0A920C5N2_9BACI|nr:hypothetical protein [Ornithinibacillus bavariensis]GIO27011.1 hypothetical protein J43TS3_16220 [Ornithinibacillus bavariensis]
MVDALLDFMLGPLRGISQFYIEHQMIMNTIVIGFAVYKILNNNKKTEKKSAS